MNPLDSAKIQSETERLREGMNKKMPFTPISAGELMAKNFPPDEWLIDKLIPRNGITALSGAPASYKTWTTLSIAIAVAAGDTLFEHYAATETGVLFVDEENGEKLLQKRLKLLPACDDLPITFMCLQGFKLSKPTVNELITYCKGNNIGFIIFDSLIRIHSSDENDASKMSQAFLMLKQFNKEGIAVLFTHHHRKQGLLRSSNPSEDMRGSSDIRASVDSHLAIHRQKPHSITITQTKNRNQEEVPPFNVTVMQDTDNKVSLVYEGVVDESQSKKDEAKKAVLDLIEQQGKPMFQREIREQLIEASISVGEKTLRIALDELIDETRLVTDKGERNKTFYLLPDMATLTEPKDDEYGKTALPIYT